MINVLCFYPQHPNVLNRRSRSPVVLVFSTHSAPVIRHSLMTVSSLGDLSPCDPLRVILWAPGMVVCVFLLSLLPMFMCLLADSLGGDIYWAVGASLIGDILHKPHWPLKSHFFVNAGNLDSLDHGQRPIFNASCVDCNSRTSIYHIYSRTPQPDSQQISSSTIYICRPRCRLPFRANSR